MRLIANCRIIEGELRFKQRSTFLSDLKQLKNGDYILILEKKRKKRSLSQNAYYWGVVVENVKSGLLDIGYRMTKDDTHEFLKGKFHIIEKVNENTGEILKAVGSTSEMTTSQMMDYFSEITQWAAEYLNIQIPQPNEQLQIELS